MANGFEGLGSKRQEIDREIGRGRLLGMNHGSKIRTAVMFWCVRGPKLAGPREAAFSASDLGGGDKKMRN